MVLKENKNKADGKKKKNDSLNTPETDEQKNSDEGNNLEDKDDHKGVEDQLNEQKEKVLRLSAEFDNFKKRKQREIDEFKKFANETITQARGAALRAIMVLSKKEIVAEGMINHVDSDLCRACGECEEACCFEAIKVKEVGGGRKRAVVTEALCTGCGGCNVVCPTGAASLAHFQDAQTNAMIDESI